MFQSFRKINIPNWISRCLESVENWAKLHGHDYLLFGDEFYELCGQEYLARGNKNPQAITNLARLVATRMYLDSGYSRVIWMDADVFVFDPQAMILDFPDDALLTGYAFGREVWLEGRSPDIFNVSTPMAHNAATYFTKEERDLDMLIFLIRHIDKHRELRTNLQVGVQLLRGLQGSLMFPTFSHVSLFSPDLVAAIAIDDENSLRAYGQSFKYKTCAANLTLSRKADFSEKLMLRVMDILEYREGEAINKYAKEHQLHLAPFEQ